jgi:sulfoxide reductase catalytic subunit YedY
MLIRTTPTIRESEITDPALYARRRDFLRGTASVALTGAALANPLLWPTTAEAKLQLGNVESSNYKVDEELTPHESVISYNNFYEFGTDKSDPAKYAQDFKTEPWSVTIEGECGKPGTYRLEDIVKPNTLEERVYRLRCVEAWSMVVPWIGLELGPLLKRFEPNSNAKYVEFETLFDPAQMPGQRLSILDWPYVEGLRIDEAMHPLTIFVVGLYGEILPNQNGAPIRLMVPWKYGFKSIKSIVKIRFVEKQPVSSWTRAAAREYGFYANVNPEVDHPRWSQAKERRIGDFFKRPTLMFNGYADQVASLYSGMDLQKNY